MSDPSADGPVGSTTLLFHAPPDRPDQGGEGVIDRPGARGGGRAKPAHAGTSGQPGLRMLKGAREAAAGMRITDAQIRAVLEDPQDVAPDPNQPQRTRLRRDGLVVTTGHDGTILRVSRRR